MPVPSPAALALARSEHKAFGAIAARLAANFVTDSTPAMSSLLARDRSAEAAFYSLSLRLHQTQSAKTALMARILAVRNTQPSADLVLRQLRALGSLESARAEREQSAADYAQTQALGFVVAGFVLAVLALIGYSRYAEVLFRRAAGRERGMAEVR